jgi:hypothetical protein
MSHKHDRLFQSIFQDPVSGNIHWREVEAMLTHLGAKIASAHGAIVHVTLNGLEGTLHRPHHSSVCTKQEIRRVREFLAAAGVKPA